MTVKFGSTAYTRFGVRNRVSTEVDNVEPGEPDNPNGVFAYSQLTASTYSSQDPSFPAGGEGSYEGATIGRDESSNYYEGSITIDVIWAAPKNGVQTSGFFGWVPFELGIPHVLNCQGLIPLKPRKSLLF